MDRAAVDRVGASAVPPMPTTDKAVEHPRVHADAWVGVQRSGVQIPAGPPTLVQKTSRFHRRNRDPVRDFQALRLKSLFVGLPKCHPHVPVLQERSCRISSYDQIALQMPDPDSFKSRRFQRLDNEFLLWRKPFLWRKLRPSWV